MRRLAFLPLLLLALAAPASPSGIDTVAAVVNGTPITATEVAREAAFVAATGLAPVDPEIAGGEGGDVLSQMILALLLRQRAEALGIAVDPAEVDAAVGRVAANNRITAAELEGKLRDDQGTWERFRGRMADRLLQPRLLDREVLSGLIISEAEVSAEYEADREHYRSPEEVRISHLLIPLSAEAGPEEVAAAEGRAAAMKMRLTAGVLLTDLAAEIVAEGGAGGDLGWFRKGELHPALEAAAFPLPVGGVADPVRTPAGIHFLTVTDRKAEGVTSLAEAKDSILAAIHRRKVAAALKGYTTKLRAEAVIRFPK